MFFKLSKNSFLRQIGKYGYITNQLTKHDRVYNPSGLAFLSTISRNSSTVDEALSKLMNVFVDVDKETLRTDYADFINELALNQYIITGETPEDLNKNDISFSYEMENPKTALYLYDSVRERNGMTDTAEFFDAEFHKNPHIFGCEIEVTSRCNERCVHCYIPHENKTADLDDETFYDVLNQLHDMGTLALTLSGGELFFRKNIADFLYYARQKDFSISILSNLTLADDELIKVIKDINVNQVQVSVYSMDASIHDEITQLPGSHKKTMKSIEKMMTENIPLQISCPTMKINKDSYRDVLKWAHGNKSKAYTDYEMMAQSNFNDFNLQNRLDIKDAENIIKDIIKFDEDYLHLIKTTPPVKKDLEKLKNKPVCGAGVNNICIGSQGNVYPCAGWQGYVAGNVKENFIKDIWENSEELKYLRNITNASFPKCLACEDRDFCSICLVRNFNESGGDMFKINPHHCDVAILNKRLADEYINKNETKI
jgi:radical SAM protein with 4Fe4S-binding SPASM domain